MFFEAEDSCSVSGVVSPDALKHGHAVVQTVGEHMQSGIAPVDHLAVFPNFSVAVSHRHVKFSNG